MDRRAFVVFGELQVLAPAFVVVNLAGLEVRLGPRGWARAAVLSRVYGRAVVRSGWLGARRRFRSSLLTGGRAAGAGPRRKIPTKSSAVALRLCMSDFISSLRSLRGAGVARFVSSIGIVLAPAGGGDSSILGRSLAFLRRGPAARQIPGESPLGSPAPRGPRCLWMFRPWVSRVGISVPAALGPDPVTAQAMRMLMESMRTVIMAVESSGTALRWRIFPPFSHWAVFS